MADSHSSDVTGADIDGAQNVVVGKGNRQEVDGHYGGQSNVTVNHPDGSEARTIRLIYELVSRLESNLVREAQGWREAILDLKTEVADLRTVADRTQRQVGEISDGLAKSVKISQNHSQAFYMGFALLALPVPLYFEGLRELIDLNWPMALLLALSCYAMSAGFWHYMWWGNR